MKSFIGLAVAIILLTAPSAIGFSYGISIDGAGYSAAFSVPSDGELAAVTALDGGSISNTFSGKGDLHENHFVKNGAGATALVRADVGNASSYTYSYELDPSPAMAQNAPEVYASESLDVSRADYIRAVALAASKDLYSSASTEIRGGSLSGYSNMAIASTDKVAASQNLDEASGSIEAYSRSEYLEDGGHQAVHVTTSIKGDLTGYHNVASSRPEGADVTENSHIVGSFKSDAVAGDQSRTRTSNFGTVFDLTRFAEIGEGSGIVSGITQDSQGYQVKPGDKIQAAIDAAFPGDTIKVLPGIYYENLKIDKSVNVSGMDQANRPIIDGSKNSTLLGSAVDISSRQTVCSLNRLDIRNGRCYTGGGILNMDGTVTVVDCAISGNSANYGGGVWSSGKMTIIDSTISENTAKKDQYGSGGQGGGIYNNRGIMTIVGSKIIGNNAVEGNGGGILNDAVLTVKDSTISDNSAKFTGGGILNDGTTTIQGKTMITHNTAELNGGGIFNHGTITVSADQLHVNQPNDLAP